MKESISEVDEATGQSDLKTVQIRIPEDLFREYSSILALRGETKQSTIEEFIRNYVESN